MIVAQFTKRKTEDKKRDEASRIQRICLLIKKNNLNDL